MCESQSQFSNEFVLQAAVQLHKNKVYFIIVLQMFNVCFRFLLTLAVDEKVKMAHIWNPL